MNIFPLEHRIDGESLTDWCDRIAHSHCDQHQKLILEAWQQLNSSCNVLGIKTDNDSATHKNHPCTKWVRKNLSNWQFTIEYANSLAFDMADRYGRDELHKSAIRISENIPCDANDLLRADDITEFACAMPDSIKNRHVNAVDAYREYYCLRKSWFVRKERGGDKYIITPAKWKHGDVPEWFNRNPIDKALIGGCISTWQGSKSIVLTKSMVKNIEEMRCYVD